MRAAALFGLAFLVALAAGPAAGGEASPRAGCRSRTTTSVRLPAAVTITTSCGTYRLGRDGRVKRTSASRSPVPAGVGWSPYTGIWDKVVDGHLVVGRWQKRLWRSSGSFPLAYAVGAIAVGPHALAFSYGTRVPQLYLARFGRSERRIASGEYPLGWTSGGMYTRASRGGALLLRSGVGALREALARRVWRYAYDRTSGSLYLIAEGTLFRADGAGTDPIVSLRRLGLSTGRALQLQPLGRLVALEDARRLVVLRTDGTVFASTLLPRGRTRVDGISSQLSAAPDGRAVAFTSTRGNTAYGSRGTETVYLLRSGSDAAQPIHTERVDFAVCERNADLAWHGRWLLYGASEGNTAIIDTSRPRQAIELARIVEGLPGVGGDEGDLDVSVSWTGRPTGT